VAARDQLFGGEGLRMATVRVERGEEGRTVVHDADTGVSMAVDAALVSLGKPEPPLQVLVVLGKCLVITVNEQPRREALHQSSHVVVERRRPVAKREHEHVEVGPALGRQADAGLERAVDEAQFDDIPSHLVEGRLDRGDPLVDARRELPQFALTRPPFFAPTQRWSESRTSPSASAMRRPGGSRGPPWPSFRIPRMAAA